MDGSMAKLDPVERRSVSDEVVLRLGEYIIGHGLKAGHKLPAERELMESLRVGRSSLREAIKALRAIGVIEVVAGGGMYVGRGGMSGLTKPLSWAVFLNASNIRQAIEAREVLETELAARAAEHATDEQLAELRTYIEQMRSAPDPQSYRSADVAFHLGIARAAGNEILYSAIEMLQHVIGAWIDRILRKAGGVPQGFPEHEEIYEALLRRKPKEARRAMKTHLELSSQRLLAASEAQSTPSLGQNP